jgi:hypothetical protein
MILFDFCLGNFVTKLYTCRNFEIHTPFACQCATWKFGNCVQSLALATAAVFKDSRVPHIAGGEATV